MTRGARPNVVVLDYGSGNLRSAERALQRVGADIVVTADADSALDAAGLVVPGVGAFASCMTGLRAVRGDMIIAKRLAEARPVLGICVGMQVLFAQGVEHGERTAGCGVWPGVVERLEAPVLPHMGWNTVSPPAGSRLFAGIGADERFYFVHSYAVRSWPVRAEGDPVRAGAAPVGADGDPVRAGAAPVRADGDPVRPDVEPAAPLLTWAVHGQPFVAAAEDGPLCATQFHPEKSGEAGAALLANWLELIR